MPKIPVNGTLEREGNTFSDLWLPKSLHTEQFRWEGVGEQFQNRNQLARVRVRSIAGRCKRYTVSARHFSIRSSTMTRRVENTILETHFSHR
jgi:hypothetical protein